MSACPTRGLISNEMAHANTRGLTVWTITIRTEADSVPPYAEPLSRADDGLRNFPEMVKYYRLVRKVLPPAHPHFSRKGEITAEGCRRRYSQTSYCTVTGTPRYPVPNPKKSQSRSDLYQGLDVSLLPKTSQKWCIQGGPATQPGLRQSQKNHRSRPRSHRITKDSG